MKHIIEKHVTERHYETGCSPDIIIREIKAKDFPALISDLEAEWCKFLEWAENNCMANYRDFHTAGNWFYVGESYTTAELLKIYQNKEK